MSETTNLKLFKHDNPSTNENQFDIEEALNENWDKIDTAYGNLNTNKVDKEEGKGLSTNDFTNELKAKLDNLENYDDTEIKQDISDIQKKDEQQDAEIENLKSENTELKAENERLRKDIDNNIPTVSDSGENITLEDTTESRFTKFSIGGNSKQETRSGKNKLKVEDGTITVNGITATVKDGEITLNGTATVDTWISFAPILKNGTSADTSGNPLFEVNSAGKYTMSANEISGTKNNQQYFSITAMKTSGQFSFNLALNNYSVTTDLSSTDQIYGVWILISKDTVLNNYKFNLQIEQGETATEYEKYGAMPSTEFISEIRNCGDNVNLFDVAGTNFNESGKKNFTEKMSIGDTSVGASVYSDLANNSRCRAYYKVLANEIITISFNNEFTMTYVLEADNSGVIKKTEFNKSTSYTYAATEDTVLCLIFSKVDSTEFSNDDIGKLKNSIKIEKGSKATTYSKYGEGNANITVCNKNFAPEQWEVGYYNADGTYSASVLYRCFRKVLAAGIYTLSYDADLNLVRYVNLTDKTNLSYNDSLKRITLTKTTEISFAYRKTDSSAWDLGENLADIEYQIEAGTIETEFTEHKEQNFTFPLAQNQKLMKNDYLADDGIHHKRKQIELDGTEGWFIGTELTNTYSFGLVVDNKTATSGLCNTFKTREFGVSSIDEEFVQVNTSSTIIYVRINKNRLNTVDVAGFKEWLASRKTAGTPVIVEYGLENEEIDEYTEEQQAIYDEIKKTVHSYEDVTHIFSTDETSLIFDVEAKRDIQTQNDNLQLQINEIKELLSTTATSALLLNNMQSDLESEVE